MKYKDLIKRFEPYAEEEVSLVKFINDIVIFYPVSDGDNEIIALQIEDEEPYRVHEGQL